MEHKSNNSVEEKETDKKRFIDESTLSFKKCRDLTAIVSALEYNTFFRGLKVTHTRLSHETLERILHVLRRSMWLEELHLESLGLRLLSNYLLLVV